MSRAVTSEIRFASRADELHRQHLEQGIRRRVDDRDSIAGRIGLVSYRVSRRAHEDYKGMTAQERNRFLTCFSSFAWKCPFSYAVLYYVC